MPEAYRVGIGGIAIESSTFSPLPTALADFTVLRGEALLDRYRFAGDEVAWQPCLYARSIPGGPLTPQTYQTLKQELLDRVRAVLPLDGFYFDIHGAMSVNDMDDAEADLAKAIRQVVGPKCLISAPMDLHGNVSAALVQQVDLFTAYRHAPHIDAPETRERACANLLRCLDEGIRPVRAWARIPVILPGERTSTRYEPARSLWGSLDSLNTTPGVIDASVWVGYVWADEPRSAASVVVTGTGSGAVEEAAAQLAQRYWDARHEFAFCTPTGTMDWCIGQALMTQERPVVISDSGDNPTAGGVGDTPYALERLLASKVFATGERTAIVASITDSAAVAACFSVGMAAVVSLSLGGKQDPVNAQPLSVEGRVVRLNEDDAVAGQIAVLKTDGIHVIITSRRKPFHFVRDFTSLGLDPADTDVVVVKIGYLEPELAHIAKCALLALTPGAVNQDIRSLKYTRVQRPMFPLDDDIEDPELTVRVF